MINTVEFKKVCRLESLKEGCGKKFVVDEVEIALFRRQEEVSAVSNICPHQHSAIIYDGFVEDNCVVCPAHGWEFDLRTGKMKTGSRGLESFPVKIIDGEIYVKVEKRELRW